MYISRSVNVYLSYLSLSLSLSLSLYLCFSLSIVVTISILFSLSLIFNDATSILTVSVHCNIDILPSAVLSLTEWVVYVSSIIMTIAIGSGFASSNICSFLWLALLFHISLIMAKIHSRASRLVESVLCRYGHYEIQGDFSWTMSC